LQGAYKRYFCESRIDQGNCYAEPEHASQVLNIFCLLASLVAIVELGIFFLNVPSTLFRRVLRVFFYVSFPLVGAVSLMLVLLSLAWIFIGALQQPSKIGPYALAAVGMLVNIARYHGRLRRIQARVKFHVVEQLDEHVRNLARKYPAKVVSVLVENNIHDAMHANGLSAPRVVARNAVLVLILIVAYTFIFIGFQAFTDAAKPLAGLLNTVLVFFFTLVLMTILGGDNDRMWVEEYTQAMTEQVLESMAGVLETIKGQLRLASKLLRESDDRVRHPPFVGER